MAFDRSNYVASDDQLNKFVMTVSDNTAKANLQAWTHNIRANRENVKRDGWACKDFFEKGKGKIAVVMGASPAIVGQLGRLRELQHDKDVVLVGISAGIRHLVSEGIRPPYVFISDCSDKMVDWFKGMDDTSGMTLIADVSANITAVDLWREKGGNVKYMAVLTANKALDRKTAKWYDPINGSGHFMSALSSQYNMAAAFSFQVLCSPVLIFVGNELSFPSDDPVKDKYYPDRTDEKDHWERRPVRDIYGKKVFTTFMFYQMKLALEDYLGKVCGAGWFFNATEAGIFGVTRGEPVPWIRQFTLKNAINQGKHILYYGRPLTFDHILTRPPSLFEIQRYAGGLQ